MKRWAVSLIVITSSFNLVGSNINLTPHLVKFKAVKEVKVKKYKGLREDIQQRENEYQLKLYWKKQIEEARRRDEERKARERELRSKVTLHYNPYNLLEPSNLTEEKAEIILQDFPLRQVSSYYVRLEKRYGVNAIFLMALSREESGNGNSYLARNNNNLGGVKGSSGFRHYNSWEESLNDTAKLIKNEYLTQSGSYYNGVSIWNVNTLYCEQSNWADKLNNLAYEMIK